MTDVHTVLSSTALLSSCGAWRVQALVSFMESMYIIIAPPLFWLPLIFPSIIVFPEEPCLPLMSWLVNSFSFVVFAISDLSGLMCSRAHLFVFLVIQTIHRALSPCHASKESSFSYSSSLLCVVIGKIRV